MAKSERKPEPSLSKMLNDGGDVVLEKPKKVSHREKKPKVVYVFELLNKLTIPGTDIPPPPFTLRNPCLVYHEETGKRRTLRLLKGENSVWADEQTTPQQNILKNMEQVTFVGGLLRAEMPVQEPLINFLMHHDDREGKEHRINNKPVRYRLHNPEVLSVSKIDFFALKEKAIRDARNADFEDMVLHAKRLGIAIKDEYQQEREEEEIRADYIAFADRDPVKFSKYFGDPTLKTRTLIEEVVKNGAIDTEHVKGEVRWGDTKALILRYDIRKSNAIDALVNFAYTKEGTEFLEFLEK